MNRPILLAALLLTALGLTVFCADAPSPLPKDTLPEKLSLDDIPLGLGPRNVPESNPLTATRAKLGRALFFDPILSADGTVACATCHRPDRGFASGEPMPRGLRGQATLRRAPTLLNRAYGSSFFWDGREDTLEAQALRPIENPTEMGSSVADVVKRLQESKDYKPRFGEAFPDGVTASNLGKSLACFERLLLRGDSRVDRFRKKSEHDALTPEERRGLWLYESKGRCWRCHGGANFTDEGFHNTGVGWGLEPVDLGRHAVTKKDADKGKFKTPTLRGVSLTGPYMHNGGLATLEDVVEHYNKGGIANPNLDPVLEPLHLSKDEVRDLMAFLKAL